MASIKKYSTKKGTYYEAFVYAGVDQLTGKQINLHKKGFRTKKEASAWADRTRVEVQKKGAPNKQKIKDNASLTYNDVYQRWIEQYIYQVKPSTFIKTKGLFENHILPEIGEYYIMQIPPHICQLAVNEWRGKLVNFENVFQYMRKIFIYAQENDIIEKNPCDKVIMPKAIEDIKAKSEKKFWTKEELNAFLSACHADERNIIYPFFRLLAYTGLRRGEILALRWQDVNLKEHCLTVNRSITLDLDKKPTIGTPKNRSSYRTISLDPETTKILSDWKKEQAEILFKLGFNSMFSSEQLVFSNDDNKIINQARPLKWLRQVCKKAEIQAIGIHGLRHTHCTLLIEAGVNIKEVQHRLGHSDIETTLRIYTHINSKRKDHAINEFAKYLERC